MIIRKARSQDIRTVRDFYKKVNRYESRFEKKDAEKENTKFEKLFEAKPKGYLCYIAFDGEKPVAYADGHTSDLFDLIRNCGYVRNVFVISEYRKKGIGHNLIQVLILYFRRKGRKKVVLDTYPKNKSAVKVWEAEGFQKSGRNSKFVRMGKKIQP